MGKSKKSVTESLVDKYNYFLGELEKLGQDVNEGFKNFGGKDAFIQYIQDIEDDVANDPAEVFRMAYSDGDIKRCIRAIINMAKNDYFYYKRGLRKILYTEGNLLKNPLNYVFTEEDYNKTRSILVLAAENLKHLSKVENSAVSEEMAEIYCEEIFQIKMLYECLYYNRIQNEKILDESSFLNYSLPQIFKSFLVFFQSQNNIAREEIEKRWHSQEYITGFESQVATENVSLISDIHVSFSDILEQLIENMDALFRYIYYLKGDEKFENKDSIEQMSFITPYNSQDFSLLVNISLLDVHLMRVEESFRYMNWNIGIIKSFEGKDIYGFYPNDDRLNRIHMAAELREKNNFIIGTLNKNMENMMFQSSDGNIGYEHNNNASQNVDLKKGLPGGFFSEYLSTSKKINIKDIESFHFDKDEYRKLATYADAVVESAKTQNKPYYFTCVFNDMDIEKYLDAYVFLYTLSKIYYCAAVMTEELENLVPFVSLDYLYNEYSNVSGIKKEKAKKLIDCYVFDKKISRDKRYGDIFTRPLISVGSDMVLMSEALINQMNLDRNIEVLLDWSKVNLAPMGKELEHKLVNELKYVTGLYVNSNKIEFMAFDGKNVEFDFIAVFDDYLLLIEIKSLLRPYDYDELFRRRKTMLEGVEQINRRMKVLKKDWNKIKEMVNITLPDEPFDDDHVIKVVCTDIGNFTGLEIDGVVMTDASTVIKYFTNPYVDGVFAKSENAISLIKKRVLWENGKPTAKEFISYLHNPNTMTYFMECIESEWKYIPVYEGYKLMAFQDLVVKDDPLKKMYEEILSSC